jgi:hypothetical protein
MGEAAEIGDIASLMRELIRLDLESQSVTQALAGLLLPLQGP